MNKYRCWADIFQYGAGKNAMAGARNGSYEYSFYICIIVYDFNFI